MPRISASFRPTAEMIPEVTVWSKPNGEPIARTQSPTRAFELLPFWSGRYCVVSTLITATSDPLSVPTTLATASSPSENWTLIWSAPSTTWLLVTMWPRSS